MSIGDGRSSSTESVARSVLLGGRYELGDLLGSGGMADVRIGIDQRLGRTVAVKALRAHLASDPTFRARFRREAQSAAALNHSSVVAVYDTGEDVLDGVSIPYIVMEYVEGRTLRDVLREGGRIMPERAMEITADVLDALEYSHRAGIIHRDIKPANVMLTPDGDVKVMDFGIARAVADSSATMTQTAAVVGTAQYLSPEQARGESVDARSDIYSTGCLLYELLTGRPPFVGDSPVEVAYQHVREQPQAPSTFESEVPPEADGITLKALEKEVRDRYQSAAEMRADIERGLSGQRVTAPVAPVDRAPRTVQAVGPPVPPVDSDADGPPTVGRHGRYDESRRRRRVTYGLVGVALLALAGAAVFVGLQVFGGQPERVLTPRLLGMSAADAKALLKSRQLKVGRANRAYSRTVPEGQLAAQRPRPGVPLAVGGTVDITVSRGEPRERVPEVIGLQVSEARTTLEAAGFRVSDREDLKSTKPEGEVTRIDPPEGSVVTEGSQVTVYYSTGMIKVPDVRRKSEAVARAMLVEAGFKVSKIRDIRDDVPAGTVVSQVPDPGTRRMAGSRVSIIVAEAPKPTPTQTPKPTPTPSETDFPFPLPNL